MAANKDITLSEEELAAQRRTPTQLAFRRFRKNRRAVASAILLVAVAALAIIVPFLPGFDYRHQELQIEKSPPTLLHPFGTDSNGRDLMTRVYFGGRVSFAVGIMATTVAVIIGVAYGAISAFAGGKLDLLMMRVVDVLYGLPYMFIVIIAMVIFGRNWIVIFLVLGGFGWLTMARIVRGQVLSLKEREFVEAARALGTPTGVIIFRHIVPNILGPVIVYTTLTIPAVMLQEAFLSFLGLGVSEPQTSWGVLINEGADALRWWMIVFPGFFLALTLYCLNSVGDGLRDAFDVRQR